MNTPIFNERKKRGMPPIRETYFSLSFTLTAKLEARYVAEPAPKLKEQIRAPLLYLTRVEFLLVKVFVSAKRRWVILFIVLYLTFRKMLKFRSLFPRNRCVVIGMIHIEALPGTPRYKKSIEKIVRKACIETEIYLKHDIDGIIVENMHDVPYIQSKHFTPEVVASMARICSEIKRIVPQDYPCGVQVLAVGNKEAVAIAQACSFDFIRAEGFVFSHVADEGFTDANAGLTLRYRKHIEAEDVLIFADIKKKHSSHAITNDVSLVETVKAAEFFLADGIILTGTATGSPADPEELYQVRKSSSLPILVGSGVTASNLQSYISADALIVGSHFKHGGQWDGDLDELRVATFMQKKKEF